MNLVEKAKMIESICEAIAQFPHKDFIKNIIEGAFLDSDNEKSERGKLCLLNFGDISFYAEIHIKKDNVLVVRGVDENLQPSTKYLVLKRAGKNYIYRKNRYDTILTSTGEEVQING